MSRRKTKAQLTRLRKRREEAAVRELELNAPPLRASDLLMRRGRPHNFHPIQGNLK